MAAGDVTINGVTVDISDPCAVAVELKKAEIILATGGSVALTRFGSDEVQWTRANLADIQSLIRRYEAACAAKSGKRLRYAKRMRFAR